MKRLSLKSEQITALLRSESYREFALQVIAIRASTSSPLTYAHIGRMLGVKSRSYPRDILLGKKRLTPVLLPRLENALGLPSELRRYFELLVERDEPGCRISGNSPAKIEKNLANTKNRILQKEVIGIGHESAFQLSDIPKVYAALGTVEGGSSLREITSRLNFGEERVRAALPRMIEMKLCHKQDRRYFPQTNHVNTSDMRQSEIFKKYFQNILEEVMSESRANMNSTDKLFFSSALSVRKDRMSELKNELRSLLLKFVDTSEETNGDQVVSLLCALH